MSGLWWTIGVAGIVVYTLWVAGAWTRTEPPHKPT
jgi:hypothetical protein